jgi:iron(III) transport system substrate-binding protein
MIFAPNRLDDERGGCSMTRRLFLAAVLGSLGAFSLLAGCSSCQRGQEVVVYTSVDQVFSEPVLRRFESETGLRVLAVYDTEETKSTGVVNRLIAEGQSPRADVFWSNDPVRQLLLVGRGQVEPYRSPAAEGLPAYARPADGLWTGFAARARVLLVNTRLVDAADMPSGIESLADPRWRGKAAIANPLYGTTTMHVAALATVWGQAKAEQYLRALKDNDVRIASSNGEVQRLVVSGEVAIGLCDTDDANEAVKGGAPVAVVFPDRGDIGTLVMPTTAVIIRGGPHPAAARRLIDYLVSAAVEEQMAQGAAHMPLRPGVRAPAGAKTVGEIKAMNVDYARVADQIEQLQPLLRTWVGL